MTTRDDEAISTSRRIGPYQIEGRLGSGGMGEVLRAWDERLERWVALKRLHPGTSPNEEQRLRFQREARAAAALTHPAVVQVHDILQTSEGDVIVMELVEGRSLAAALGEGPLGLERGLAVAREVTSGLGAAHALGIVHRDLKSENVVLTTEGGAKILDFGVAKRWLPAGHEELTAKGEILGTYRAMSPEQARGLEVDPRSDLFALGSLFYEIFTGRSPFRAADPLVTLDRVLNLHPPPLRSLDPRLPRELSDLVARLLEKRPERRPRSAEEVAERLATLELATPASLERDPTGEPTARLLAAAGAAPVQASESETLDPKSAVSSEGATDPGPPVPNRRTRPTRAMKGITGAVVLGLLGLFAWKSHDGRPDRIYIAVAEPTWAAPASDERQLLSVAIATSLFQGLLTLEGTAPLSTEGLDPLPTAPTDLALALGAREVLTSRLDCRSKVCRAELRRLHGADGQVLWAESFDLPADDLPLVSSAVVGRVQSAFPELARRSDAPALGIDGEDYATFLRLHRAFREQSLPVAELLGGLAALRTRAPDFPEVYRLEAKVVYDAYFYSRNPADLERAFDLLHRADRLAPGHAEVLHEMFRVALDSGEVELARDTLHRLETLEPGAARVRAQSALLLEHEGRPAEALAQLRASVRQHPSWRGLYELASMESRLGQVDAARQSLEELLQRVPGHYNASSFLAQLELFHGALARAEELYEQLIEQAPGVAELSNLGLVQMLGGNLDDALRSFEQAVEMAPENPFLLLNLADATFLRGDKEGARTKYRRVQELAVGDPSEPGWQLLSTRAQALAHLGEAEPAAEAIQQALRLAPESPQAAYEAALVYCLIGETTSARVNARRALEGFGPRWFRLPWFEPLHDLPELQLRAAA